MIVALVLLCLFVYIVIGVIVGQIVKTFKKGWGWDDVAPIMVFWPIALFVLLAVFVGCKIFDWFNEMLSKEDKK